MLGQKRDQIGAKWRLNPYPPPRIHKLTCRRTRYAPRPATRNARAGDEDPCAGDEDPCAGGKDPCGWACGWVYEGIGAGARGPRRHSPWLHVHVAGTDRPGWWVAPLTRRRRRSPRRWFLCSVPPCSACRFLPACFWARWWRPRCT